MKSARAERMLSGEKVIKAAWPHLKSLKRALYPYQEDGVRRVLGAERFLLADDMGLGKTTQAVAACHALFHAGLVRRGVLIVPSSLKPQWVREWESISAVPVTSVDGNKEERDAQYRAHKKGCLVIAYEQLLRDVAEIHALAPELVAIDEAQRIKNWHTKSSVYVNSLTPRFRLVLTGTPMENRLEELATLLDWIDDTAMAPKWRIEPWFTVSSATGGRAKAGARNLDTLRERIRPVLLRRVRTEVLKQLPPRTDTRISVPMTDEQRAAHDDLIQPIASLLNQARARPLTPAQFPKLMTLLGQQRIISNGLGQLRFQELWPAYANAAPDRALIDGLFAPKLHELRRVVESVVIDQGRKLVVFSQWRRMLQLAEWSIRDLLDGAGMRAAFFTGAESTQLRTQGIVEFHDNPDVRIMFLSDAGGVGLNLQRAASACVNLELPWNPAVLEQRIGRIYRIGQSRPIDVFNLVNEYGIEARIAELVSTKRALFSGLFDGTSDEVKFDTPTSFLNDVERLVPEAPAVAASEPALLPAADDVDAPVDAPEEAAALEPAPPAVDSVVTPGASASREDSAPAPRPAGASQAPDATVIQRMFGAVEVRRTASGGLTIEAPPEAAASLFAVFEGMAKLMGQAARGP